jgi:hypothetical protein
MSKKIDLQSLRKASMDPVLKFKMGQRTKVKGIVTAQDKLLILLETLRPETRKVTLQQLRDYVQQK